MRFVMQWYEQIIYTIATILPESTLFPAEAVLHQKHYANQQKSPQQELFHGLSFKLGPYDLT